MKKNRLILLTIMIIVLSSCASQTSLNENITDFNLVEPTNIISKYNGPQKAFDGFTMDYLLFDLGAQTISESEIEENPYFLNKPLNNNGYCTFSSSFFETDNNELINFMTDQKPFNCYVLMKDKDVSLIIFSKTEDKGAYIFLNNYK